jgi:hypothetical protein
MSRLARWVESGMVPLGYWIAADEAYDCGDTILTPFPSGGRDVDEDSFNAYLTQCRLVVECAFGILVKRWGLLWRPMDHSPRASIRLVLCCVALHNAIIDFRLAENPHAHDELPRDVLFWDKDTRGDYRDAPVREAYMAPPTAEYKGKRVDRIESRTRSVLVGKLADANITRHRPLTDEDDSALRQLADAAGQQ